MGVRPQTVWRYEAGAQEPSGDALARLCEVLGMTAQEIMYGAAPPPVRTIERERPAAYEAWLATIAPAARPSPEQEARLLAARFKNPTAERYQLLWMAIRDDHPLSDPVVAAETTAEALERARSRGGRMITMPRKK